jgi:hypothetical protein
MLGATPLFGWADRLFERTFSCLSGFDVNDDMIKWLTMCLRIIGLYKNRKRLFENTLSEEIKEMHPDNFHLFESLEKPNYQEEALRKVWAESYHVHKWTNLHPKLPMVERVHPCIKLLCVEVPSLDNLASGYIGDNILGGPMRRIFMVPPKFIHRNSRP